jgi:hypothetical protein
MAGWKGGGVMTFRDDMAAYSDVRDALNATREESINDAIKRVLAEPGTSHMHRVAVAIQSHRGGPWETIHAGARAARRAGLVKAA